MLVCGFVNQRRNSQLNTENFMLVIKYYKQKISSSQIHFFFHQLHVIKANLLEIHPLDSEISDVDVNVNSVKIYDIRDRAIFCNNDTAQILVKHGFNKLRSYGVGTSLVAQW